MLRLMCAVLLLFQSTLPREERPDEFKSYIENEHFNPRSHERSDHCSLYHLSVLQLFQSTLPREERPKAENINGLFEGISIHAPTRGATLSGAGIAGNIEISIHAPTRGATVDLYDYYQKAEFQSTLPREERHFTVSLPMVSFKFQSTLPREERPSVRLYKMYTSVNFNPRSHERSDDGYTKQSAAIDKFQSTLPREERQGNQ